MNDPGLDQPISDGAQRVDDTQDREDASIEKEQERESAFLDPTCEVLAYLSSYSRFNDCQVVTVTSTPPCFLWSRVPLVQWRRPSIHAPLSSIGESRYHLEVLKSTESTFQTLAGT